MIPNRGVDNFWWHLRAPAASAAWNMALDEALLLTMPVVNRPVLRFYSWNEPAASFGYFQKYSEIEKLTMLRPLIRRPTGGGLVLHDADWTYSACFPAGSEWYELSATSSYEGVHRWIQRSFQMMNVDLELAASASATAPGQCFVGHEKSDLLWRGKKIAGAAQRRTRNGLLIQGSVQPPPLELDQQEWEAGMLSTKPPGAPSWRIMGLDDLPLEQAKLLVETRYCRESYNRKR